MTQPLKYTQTEFQKIREQSVKDFLKDGPKTTEHLLALLGLYNNRDVITPLTMAMSKMPVYLDDGLWHLITTPKNNSFSQKFFRLRGSPMIQGMEWNGIGGIQALWT